MSEDSTVPQPWEEDTEQWLLEQFTRLNPDLLFVVSPDWDDLVYASDAYEEIWGRSLDDLADDPTRFVTAVHPEDRDTVVERMDDVAQGTEVELEFRIVRDTDGEVRHLWSEAKPVYDDGEFVAIAGFTRDVTERARIRNELQATNDELESLASFLSHDLLNQVQLSKMYVEEVKETTDDELLEKATDSLDRMTELTEDVLSLFREEQTRSETPVELRAVAEESWETAGTVDGELRVEDDARVVADRGQLKQIFENLFRNSVVHAETEVVVEVGCFGDGTGVYVADDGPGIPTDERETVFEPRYTTESGGTGLGLALVEKTATAHGWEVTVTDSEAGGARFELGNVEFATE